jgi:glyoxylase-like metal-dependent hydrolase (beta-lactamase superfamily II)
MSDSQETPRPPQTAEFGYVTADGPAHDYPIEGTAAIRKISVGAFDNNVYVIRCTETGEALVIDGAADPARITDAVGDATVVGIAQTHAHHDHIAALRELADTWRCPVYAHDDDRYPVEHVSTRDGDEIAVGSLVVRVLHTPGHTPGSLSFLCGSTLFSGDTLFPGGPGATQDPDRFAEIMGSLSRLFALDDATRVCPGHGLDTTIGRERPHVETWRARGW